MNHIQHSFRLICIGISLIYSAPVQAGWLCDGLGIGCDPIPTTGRSADDDAPAPTVIDQNNPPKIFSFTISGKFTQWTDIAPETFVCDTRKREDRSCIWEGYIPEIKRNATVIFKPFAHDRGMYETSFLVAHNLGKDMNYRASGVRLDGGPFPASLSISWLVENPFQVLIRKSNYKGEVDRSAPPYGHLDIAFKEVLR